MSRCPTCGAEAALGKAYHRDGCTLALSIGAPTVPPEYIRHDWRGSGAAMSEQKLPAFFWFVLGLFVGCVVWRLSL